MQPEAKFKTKLRQAYQKAFPQGWYQYNSAVLKRGVPDQAFMLPTGVVLWVESKVVPNDSSAAQLHAQTKIAGAGGYAFVFEYEPETRLIWVRQRTPGGSLWRGRPMYHTIPSFTEPKTWSDLVYV